MTHFADVMAFRGVCEEEENHLRDGPLYIPSADLPAWVTSPSRLSYGIPLEAVRPDDPQSCAGLSGIVLMPNRSVVIKFNPPDNFSAHDLLRLRIEAQTSLYLPDQAFSLELYLERPGSSGKWLLTPITIAPLGSSVTFFYDFPRRSFTRADRLTLDGFLSGPTAIAFRRLSLEVF